MEFMVNIDLKKPERQISYRDKIFLIGSCFTEHIGNSLQQLKFSIVQNPNGILFDPYSVCSSLRSYVVNKHYSEADFFQLNDVWHSWRHHSRYSHTSLDKAVQAVNHSQQQAHEFLKTAEWTIITLGSSFSYRLTDQAVKTREFYQQATSGDLPAGQTGLGVANCHRAPAQWFDKHLMTIDETVSCLTNCLEELSQFNPRMNIIFTVSPVRHIRDGVVNNNRSKARLIESVHCLVNKFDNLYYFPAYELVIDVLRDYRFYDVDLVHPNYMATEFVLQKFREACIDEQSQKIMDEVSAIVTARKHKAFHPETESHGQFLQTCLQRTRALQNKYPFIDFTEEINYFLSGKQIL